ncbi:MAG: transketolase [Actinomycetaceae bacterium]|nr:transketolase [Actinomycetaceae bacterium]
MSFSWEAIDIKAVDTARVLAADAVENAGSGHPGTAISMAPAAYLIYQRHLRFDPRDTDWLGRDRFVLSMGHSSLTQYIQLYLAGVGLELDDLKAFRHYGSKTPGHPEYKHTKGVEITTGPLGSGLASAVGIAMAQRRERGLFDPDAPAGTSPFDHNVYVFAGDGCLQEGISSEACSLAGTQGLGNLILIYDDNHISIEDDTKISFTEDVLKRYEAYGWHTQRVDWLQESGEYAEDVAALDAAVEAAKAEKAKPSIIALRTIIGWPTPGKQDTGGIHGAKLGDEALKGLKKAVGFNTDAMFDVDASVIEHTRSNALTRGKAARDAWNQAFESWAAANPERKALLDRLAAHKLPEGWRDALPTFEAGTSMATRAASGNVLSALAPVLPELWGGSADLAGSNNTTMKGEPSFLPEGHDTKAFQGNPYGRTLHFGVREHAMGAILNGMALDGLTLPYGGTFFVFADYMRGAVRLTALMDLPVTFVWTHDSIGVGEDGPTHQPVEHLSAYRAIPGLAIVRPADANETADAWAIILEKRKPTGLILSRQNLPVLQREASAADTAKGGYVLKDCAGTPDVIVMGSGSEVQLAVGAAEALESEGIKVRVVSMPCMEWFEEQDQAYKDSVLLPSVKARVSVEAGLDMPWQRYIGDAGEAVAMTSFGAPGAADTLFEHFGITQAAVEAAAKASIAKAKS